MNADRTSQSAVPGAPSGGLQEELIGLLCREMSRPLATIEAYAELLEDQASGPVTAGQKRELRTILASSKGLQRMVRNLSDFALFQAQGLPLLAREVDFTRIVSSASVRMAHAYRTRNVRLRGKPAPTSPLGRSDPVRLLQLVENLLDVALRFSPDGGEVALGLLEIGGALRLDLLDQGNPIPGARLDSLFTLDASLEGGDGSTRNAGLELTVSRAIAEAHGGSLEIWNRSEGGVACRVVLPVDAARTPEC